MPYLVWFVPLGIAAFFNAWVVVPAPIFALLPLSVGAPEISPLLIAIDLVGCLCFSLWGWPQFSTKPRLLWIAVMAMSLCFSASPLMRWPQTNHHAATAFRTVLGDRSLQPPPGGRPAPLVWQHLWQGIPQQPVKIDRALPFACADGVSLSLTLYRPARAKTNPYPTLISVYGGAWQRGGPNSDADFNRYIAAQGYAVWAISYRHAPAHRFPAQLTDVRAALDFIQGHGAEYNSDLRRVGLIGRSAGAQLALLAAYGPTPFPVRSVINYYGPVDLAAGYRQPPVPDPIDSRAVLEAFLGGSPATLADLYRQASPLSAVRSGLPPTLLIYGGKDRIVESRYGRGLAQGLTAAGNRAVFLEIPWADHAFDVLFAGPSNQLALYYTERFLAATLQE